MSTDPWSQTDKDEIILKIQHLNTAEQELNTKVDKIRDIINALDSICHDDSKDIDGKDFDLTYRRAKKANLIKEANEYLPST